MYLVRHQTQTATVRTTVATVDEARASYWQLRFQPRVLQLELWDQDPMVGWQLLYGCFRAQEGACWVEMTTRAQASDPWELDTDELELARWDWDAGRYPYAPEWS